MHTINVIAILTAILFVITLAKQTTPVVKAGEIHHLYIGLVLVILGNLISSPFVGVVGDVLAVDDSIQHFVQAAFYPKFQSPIHWLYAKYLWPMKWIQNLTAFLNGLL